MNRLLVLLLMTALLGIKGQSQVFIDSKGTKCYVDSSKWKSVGTNIYFKNAGNVGIGTHGAAHEDAALEINTANKGFLLPRVGLQSTASPVPLSAHVQGMTVYNLATRNDVMPGIYLNSGTKWRRVITSTPRIVAHTKNTVTQTFVDGEPAGKVQFNTLTKTDGNFNLTTQTYTVPEDGYYKLDVILAVTPTAATNSQILSGKMGMVSVTMWYFSNMPAVKLLRTANVTRYLLANETINVSFVPCACGAGAANYILSEAELIITKLSE